MRKKEFINRLRYRIRKLDKKEINDVIAYYSELIDDRVENGEKEQEVIASLGSLDVIVGDILEEKGINRSFEETTQKKRGKMTTGKICLIVLLFPLWVVLGAILFVALVAVAGLIVGIGAATAGIFFAGVFYAVGSFVHMNVNFYAGLVQLGLSLLLLSIGLVFGKYVLRLVVSGGKALFRGIKNLFCRRGGRIYE